MLKKQSKEAARQPRAKLSAGSSRSRGNSGWLGGVQISPLAAKFVGALALLLIAGLDYLTDAELRVGSLYLVPVVLVAWYVGLAWAPPTRARPPHCRWPGW